MSLSRAFLKYIIVIIAVTVTALFSGQFLSKHAPAPPVTTEESQENGEETPIEKADYIASPPTFGPIIKTQPILVEFSDDLAIGYLSKKDASAAKPKQDVILFDKEDYVLPLGAQIKTLEKTENDLIKVTITLPKGANTEYLSDNLSIITLETTASKRLPITALQTDENQKDYIWVVADKNKESEKGRQVLQRLYIDVGLSDDEYFEEYGNKIESYTAVIINPDSKIKSGKKYSVYQTELIGPLHNPIRQAWIDYELNRLETQQKELNQIAEDCKNGKQTFYASPGAASLPDGTQMSACGGGGAPDVMQIFNSLINTNNNSNSAGCNNSVACPK